jgi:ClpP class serine protease
MKKITAALARNKWAIELNTGLNLYPRAHQLLTGQRATFFDAPDTEVEPIAHVISADGLKQEFTAGETYAKGVGILSIKGGLVKDSNHDCGVIGTMEMAGQVKAMAASGVSAIVLDIDSPGGQVDGTATLADAIKNAVVPTIAVVNDGMACSAGYWIASAADEVYATHPTSEVGSIGVYATLADFSKYYEDMGVRVEDIYAEQSTEKNNGYREWMEGNADTFRARLSGVASQFIATVKEHRAGKLNTQNADPFKGAVYNATEAQAIGLIDGIKSMDAVLEDLQTEKLTFTI